jgi:ERI1 exoribonuclease 3
LYCSYSVVQMDDAFHLEKFNHDCSRDLEVNIAELKHTRSQNLDFFLVLDLEGKVEILEFPVLMINAKTLDVMDFFHRLIDIVSLCFAFSINFGSFTYQKNKFRII